MRNQAPHRFLPLIKEPDAHASSDSHSKKLKNHRDSCPQYTLGTVPVCTRVTFNDIIINHRLFWLYCIVVGFF